MTLWAAWGGRKQGRRRKVLASVNVLCYVEDECTFVKDPPRFDGTTDAMSFMALFEEQVVFKHWVAVLDLSLVADTF